MPFIIPNAIDTTGSNRYNALDQAEPDALDFQILGNRATGVISGCGVTPQTVANYTVAVSSGYVAINGTVYSVSTSPALSLPSVPSNNRFDVVVVRLSGGVASPVVISGPDSATNPSFPPTPSRMTTTVGIATNTWINPDTDVVLAAIYRSGASTITSAYIVDKRVNVPMTTSLKGDVEPPEALGQNGDFYYKSDISGSAGIYVKVAGSWIRLGLAVPEAEGGVPIGTVITWVSTSTLPDTNKWQECNGAELSRAGTYSDLFGVIGTAYGAPTANTFNVPNFAGMFLSGLASGRSVGTIYGATNNQVTLTSDSIAPHNHPVGTLAMNTKGTHDHYTSGSGGSYIAGIMLRSSLANESTGSTTLQPAASGITLGIGYTNEAGDHQHTISGNTGNNLSSSTPVTIEPRNYGVKYYIKYA
jgi:microcystin-dependent protein